MSWVTLATYPSQQEAYLVAGLLQSEGINVNILSSALQDIYPGTSIGGGHSVQVDENDLERASKVLEEQKNP